ncbi:cytochrome oxidase putative small subunit CydP [Mariprofundus ferrooxydans]|uniref:cytochrome oxidase putative small subunit CydP n=1 Tax=Mariprofundus ferrooxydans TaxID=314344 RepID=UPI0030B8117D
MGYTDHYKIILIDTLFYANIIHPMMRNKLTRELAAALAIKVLFIILIWQTFFSGPSREMNTKEQILGGINRTTVTTTGIKGETR